MSKYYKKLHTILVFDGKWEKVYETTYQDTRDSHEFDFLTFAPHHSGGIFAVTDDEQVVLTRQYRFGVEDYVLELPGGGIAKDENVIEATIRELTEETGYAVQSENVVHLGFSWPMSHRSATKHELFIATGAKKVYEPQPEREEEIETVLMSLEKLGAMIRKGEVHNLVLQTLYYRYLDWKKENMTRE
jgi:ADP-ribose pyrophosphatase